MGGTLTGGVGATATVLGVIGLILGAASYLLEPYRRILLGVSGGILFGLSVATAFGLDSWLGGFFGRMLALVCGVIGGFLVPRFFDLFVIGALAVSGAALVMIGAHHIFPGVGVFDRAASGALPALLTIVLAIAGVAWQHSNIAKWLQMLPKGGDISDFRQRTLPVRPNVDSTNRGARKAFTISTWDASRCPGLYWCIIPPE